MCCTDIKYQEYQSIYILFNTKFSLDSLFYKQCSASSKSDFYGGYFNNLSFHYTFLCKNWILICVPIGSDYYKANYVCKQPAYYKACRKFLIMKITRVEEEHPFNEVDCVTLFKSNIALIQRCNMTCTIQIKYVNGIERNTLCNATKWITCWEKM